MGPLRTVFSRNVTAAMLVSTTNPPELNSVLMLTFSFVLVENMLIDRVSENTL